MQRGWDRTIGDTTITIRHCKEPSASHSADDADDSITYSLCFPSAAGGITNFNLTHHTNATWTANLTSTASTDDDLLRITIPDGTCYERLPISTGRDEILIYLPDLTVVEQCQNAINGNDAACQSLVQRFTSLLRIPLIGGVGLDADQAAALVVELAASNTHAKSRLHAYRYPLIRAALVSPTGFSVTSNDALETFINRLDAAPALGPVNTRDVIADLLATVHSHVEETTQLLTELGYDVETLAFEENGRLFCSFLATDVLTDGVSAALGRAVTHHWNVEGNYDRRKAAAESAAYEQRATAWRKLLCAAAQESIDEFAYVLANALYWTADAGRSDARTEELLYEAAATVGIDHGMRKLADRARFNHHTAAGHRLRSQHCFRMAHQRFETAHEIAIKSSVLPEWKPLHDAGIVNGHALSREGHHADAVDVLVETIETLGEHDLSPDQRANCIRHLDAQRLETKAKQRDEYDASERAAFLERAQAHYASLGFERSVARIQRQLSSLPTTESTPSNQERTADTTSDASDDTSSSTPSTNTNGENKSTNPESASPPPRPTQHSNSTPSPEPAYVDRADPHQQTDNASPAADPAPDDLDSIEYSTPPEDQHQSEDDDAPDDPYMF